MSARSSAPSVAAITHSLRDVLLAGLSTNVKRASDGKQKAEPARLRTEMKRASDGKQKERRKPSRATAASAPPDQIVQASPPAVPPASPYETIHQMFKRDKTTQQLKGDSRQVLRIPNSNTDPRTAVCFPHVNPALGLALSPSYNPKIKGLGLYALNGVKEGDVICLFTGMWAMESDVDCLYGLSDPCVKNYGATFHAHVIDHTTWPNKTRATNGSYVTEKTSVDRLMCVPRVQRAEATPESAVEESAVDESAVEESAVEESTGCHIVCDVRAGLCDVGAFFNGVARNKQAINCALVQCVVNLPKAAVNPNDPLAKQAADGALWPHAAIAVVATATVDPVTSGTKKMTELLMSYGYNPSVNVAKAGRKYGYKEFDPRPHAIDTAAWDKLVNTGRSVEAQLPVSWRMCGPRLAKVQVGIKTLAEALVAYQPVGEGQRAYLQSVLPPLPSEPHACNDNPQPAAAAAGPSNAAGPSGASEPLVVD